MKTPYYYLVSSLPELSLSDKKPFFNQFTFREEIIDQLQPQDQKLLRLLYYRYDILNLVNHIKALDQPWLPGGNFTQTALTEGLHQPDILPAFLRLFIEEGKDQWKQQSAKVLVNAATTWFINWSQRIDNVFLKKWLHFDYNLKNLLVWLNSQKHGLNPKNEVLGHHFEAAYLRKTTPDELDLSAWDFRYREVLTHFDNANIALREALIDEMRWQYLEELVAAHPFGIEPLLAYAIRLQIIHRNIETTESKGKAKLLDLLQNIRAGYEMPDQFQENQPTSGKPNFTQWVEKQAENV